MALHQKIGGVWKDCTPWVNVGGTWKKAAVWQRIGGVWTKITSLIGATLPTSISDWADPYSVAAFDLNSDGTWGTNWSGGGTWMDGGSSSDYQIRASNLSGDTPTGTFNTWMSPGASWTLGGAANLYRTCSFTLEIRMSASPNTVLDSCTISLTKDSNL